MGRCACRRDDLMGTFTNTRTVRIEWGQCDAAGIIFFPRYFEIIDASTHALLEKALGMTVHEMLKHYRFAGYPARATRAEFVKPTRFGDDVTVTSSITLGRSSFTVEHVLTLHGERVCQCTETRVWAVRDADDPERLRPAPIPAEVRSRLGAD